MLLFSSPFFPLSFLFQKQNPCFFPLTFTFSLIYSGFSVKQNTETDHLYLSQMHFSLLVLYLPALLLRFLLFKGINLLSLECKTLQDPFLICFSLSSLTKVVGNSLKDFSQRLQFIGRPRVTRLAASQIHRWQVCVAKSVLQQQVRASLVILWVMLRYSLDMYPGCSLPVLMVCDHWLRNIPFPWKYSSGFCIFWILIESLSPSSKIEHLLSEKRCTFEQYSNKKL